MNNPLPVFFTRILASVNEELILDEDTSKHVVQVLRMQSGSTLELTDGLGSLLTVEIVSAHKKHSSAKVLSAKKFPASQRNLCIGISLLKNAGRFEWFLEKATELGITEIIPLLCERTEKQHFRFDRMHQILVSAMLQSKQYWLPKLHEPTRFQNYLPGGNQFRNRFIAHCTEGEKQSLRLLTGTDASTVILIGPEGDFTSGEIAEAITQGYTAVSLGTTRLRTETAGVTAAVLLAS